MHAILSLGSMRLFRRTRALRAAGREEGLSLNVVVQFVLLGIAMAVMVDILFGLLSSAAS